MGSFQALMALASKQTEASQIALAKETQIREAREKARRLEEERKEKERIRLEKERLAKQKREDEKREQRLLEERQRKIAERQAAAELARKQQEVNTTSSTPNSRTNNRTTCSKNARPTPLASSSTPTNHHQDPEEQRMLEREEKKARARARLFGEPVSAHKKSVTSRVGNQSTQRAKTTSKANNTTPKGTAYGSRSQTLSAPSTSLTARQRIEQQFSMSVRQPLNQVKKDRRTIEEIEQDMKRKKAVSSVGTSGLSRKTQALSLELDSEKRVPPPVKSAASHYSMKELTRSPRPTTSEPASAAKRKLSTPSAAPPPKRPSGTAGLTRTTTTNKMIDSQRSASGSKLPPASVPSSNSHLRRNHKKTRSNNNQSGDDQDDDDHSDDESEEFSDQDVPVAPSIRDEIWKIMGKDRKQYTAKPIYSDDEGSDNMEADIDDVLEEEGRAARLAKLEDQREEERLRQHELEKKKRLLQSRSFK